MRRGTRGGEKTLRSSDWADAALASIADGGLASIHIDELASRLGVTKGSFYWHFDGRDALIEAALSSWEERVRELFDPPMAAGDALERVLDLCLTEDVLARVEIALAGAIEDERVTLHAGVVMRLRVGSLERAFTEQGVRDVPASVQRANMLFLGFLHVARSEPLAREHAARALREAWPNPTIA